MISTDEGANWRIFARMVKTLRLKEQAIKGRP